MILQIVSSKFIILFLFKMICDVSQSCQFSISGHAIIFT